MSRPVPKGWDRRQFLVAVEGGKGSREGYVNERLGLALHPTFDLGWVVTHLASGCAVLAGCPTREYALRAARTLASQADWREPLESLRNRPDLYALAQSFTAAWERWARSGARPAPSGVTS